MNRIGVWLSTLDLFVFELVNRHMRCRLLTFLLPKLTHVGGAFFSISSLVIVLAFTTMTYRLWAFEALLSLALSHILVHFIKKVYGRERPYLKLSNSYLITTPLKDYSFPSGHTTAVFSITVVFAIHSPLLACLLLPIAFFVGLSRMYIGLHYPTDCVFGALLGILSSFLVVDAFTFWL